MSEETKLDTETETVNTETETETTNYSDLSDEEFVKLFDNNQLQSSEEITETSKEETTQKESDSEPDIVDETITDTEPKDEDNDEDTDTKEDVNNDEINTNEDYLKVINELKEGFKAHGRTVKLKNADDLKRLVQMGVDYGSKMSAIKRYKKKIQSLDDAGITDLDTLNYLIDVYKGDKEAIKKLLKDNDIDPYDITDLEDVKYTNTGKNIASDSNVDFNITLDEVKESEHFNKIYDIIQNKWDNKSKSEILNDTTVLKGLQYEVESGRFDTIQAEVDNRKIFGEIPSDMSDIDAYRYVLDKFMKEHQQKQITEQQKPISKPKPVVTNKDIDVNKTSTKPTQSNKTTATKRKYSDNELANLSDDDFTKLLESGYFNN